MAEMAAHDTIDRLLKSQDRLRVSADRISVAFYRLEQYANRAALAMSRIGAGTSGNSSNSRELIIAPIFSPNITTTAAKEPGDWDKKLDTLSKMVGVLTIVSVLNDSVDLIGKTVRGYNKLFKKDKTTEAAQQIVCVCKCCSDDKNPTPPADPDRETRKSNSGSNSSGKSKKGGRGGKRSPLDGTLGNQTKSSTPNSNSSAASKRNPMADSDKKSPHKDNFNSFPNKSDSTQSSGLPDKTLGDKTKPTTPGPSKEPDTTNKQQPDLSEKTRPSTPPDSKKPPDPGSGPGSNNSISAKEGSGASGKWGKMGKGLLRFFGKSNAVGRAATGMAGIASAENKTAAVIEAVAGAGGATVGSIVGSAILPGAGTVVGGMVGGWLGEKTGRLINSIDWFGKKKGKKGRKAETRQPDISTASSITSPDLSLYPQLPMPLPLPFPLPPLGSPMGGNPADPQAPTYNITVEGVQVNMPKEEIDEESLARKIGWEIVSKMKSAMDNRVAT